MYIQFLFLINLQKLENIFFHFYIMGYFLWKKVGKVECCENFCPPVLHIEIKLFMDTYIVLNQ